MGREFRPMTMTGGIQAPPSAHPISLSETARARMEAGRFETAFLADWMEASFLHFEVDAVRLAETIPFPLDRHEGRAFVTLVAFTMRRFRPRFGGRATRWTTAAIATHRFLNLRTYVRGKDGAGIFFLHEWLDNRLAVLLGPATFGLPYRHASLDYRTGKGSASGRVRAPGAAFDFRGEIAGDERFAPTASLEEFLVERYTAYTSAGRHPKSFRVWHAPWRIRNLEIEELAVREFLDRLGEGWTSTLRFDSAVHSVGVKDVWMGRPRRA